MPEFTNDLTHDDLALLLLLAENARSRVLQ